MRVLVVTKPNHDDNRREQYTETSEEPLARQLSYIIVQCITLQSYMQVFSICCLITDIINYFAINEVTLRVHEIMEIHQFLMTPSLFTTIHR